MDEMCPPLHAAVVPCPKSSRQHGGFEITLHQNGGADSVSSQKVQVEICAHHFKMTWFAIAHRRLHLKPHLDLLWL